MKAIFSILLALIVPGVAALAQTAPATPPVAVPPAQGSTPVSPAPARPGPQDPAGRPVIISPGGQTALPNVVPNAAPANPAAITNRDVYADVFGGQNSLPDTQNLLLNLQADVQQALPILRSLTSGLYAATTGGVPPPGSAAEARANAQTQGTQLPQTSRPVAPQGIITARAEVVGMLGTTVYGMDRETHRQMAVLHNQLQQILPLLQQLNGTADAVSIVGNASGTNSAAFPFTNRFVPVNTPLLPGRNVAPVPR